MRYSADATVPVNARGNRKPAGASGTANEKAVAVVEGSDGSTQYAWPSRSFSMMRPTD